MSTEYIGNSIYKRKFQWEFHIQWKFPMTADVTNAPRGVACGGAWGGHVPPQALWGGGTGGGAPTGGRLLYKTAFRFNRLEVIVLYEVY